jgi:hypothetical protein
LIDLPRQLLLQELEIGNELGLGGFEHPQNLHGEFCRVAVALQLRHEFDLPRNSLRTFGDMALGQREVVANHLQFHGNSRPDAAIMRLFGVAWILMEPARFELTEGSRFRRV